MWRCGTPLPCVAFQAMQDTVALSSYAGQVAGYLMLRVCEDGREQARTLRAEFLNPHKWCKDRDALEFFFKHLREILFVAGDKAVALIDDRSG